MSLECVSYCSLKHGDCKKNVTLHFHLFPLKNVSAISGKGNIGLLLICVLQAWKWAFKVHLTPKFVLLKKVFMLWWLFIEKNFLILLNPWFFMSRWSTENHTEIAAILARDRLFKGTSVTNHRSLYEPSINHALYLRSIQLFRLRTAVTCLCSRLNESALICEVEVHL